MRTTLTINDALLRKAKAAALERNLSVGEVVEEALRVTLGARNKEGRKPGQHLKTFRGDGLQPGLDLTSGASVLDAMESR